MSHEPAERVKTEILGITFVEQVGASSEREFIPLAVLKQAADGFPVHLAEAAHQITFNLGNFMIGAALSVCLHGFWEQKLCAWMQNTTSRIHRDLERGSNHPAIAFSADTLAHLFLLNRVFRPLLDRHFSVWEAPAMREVGEKLNNVLMEIANDDRVYLQNAKNVARQSVVNIPPAVRKADVFELFEDLTPVAVVHDIHGRTSLIQESDDSKNGHTRDAMVIRTSVQVALHDNLDLVVAQNERAVEQLLRVKSRRVPGDTLLLMISCPLRVRNRFVPMLDSALQKVCSWKKTDYQKHRAAVMFCSRVAIPIAVALRACSVHTFDLLLNAIGCEENNSELKQHTRHVQEICEAEKALSFQENRRRVCAFLGSIPCAVCNRSCHKQNKVVVVNKIATEIRVECASHGNE